jgi:hypothetical protein
MDHPHPDRSEAALHAFAVKSLTPEVPLLGRALHVVRRLHDGDIQVLQSRTERFTQGAFVSISNLQGNRSVERAHRKRRSRAVCRQCV